MDENKFFKFKNLNKTWVITKRHNGNVFFKRRRYVTCLKNHPDEQCLFYDENEVKAEVERLNAGRKKCKFGYENASKYFVNQFSYRSWDNMAYNNPLSIKDINQHTTFVSLKDIKRDMLAQFEKRINDNIRQIKHYQDDLPRRIKQITDDYNRFISDYSTEKLNNEIALNELKELDIEKFVEPYETQGDRMVKVLYAKKA